MDHQVLDILEHKGDYLGYQEFKNIINIAFSHCNDADLNPLMDIHIPNKPTIARSQYMQAIYTIIRQLAKIQPKQYPIALINFDSQIKLEHNQIISIRLQSLPQIQDFKEVLGQQFYKKLILYGSHGLLNEKIEEKAHRSYSFFHWIQNKIDVPINPETQSLYLQLLKQVWYFKYSETQQTLQKIRIAYPKDTQIACIQIGIKYVREMYKRIIQNQQLKQVFIDRKQFQIKYQSSSNNNTQVNYFNQHIREIKQQLVFIANYFNHIKRQIQNKFYYAISVFLSNKEDNYVKYNDQIIGIKEISITDRIFYAKKFYRHEDFQNLKAHILESIHNVSELDYIILFGTRKQSQIILQNYLNQTNDIQKAAYISVIIKLVIGQAKYASKDNKIGFYQSLIKSYEVLLNNMDLGISRHKFDQKCTNIEVERKKRSMNKTFNFNCIKCGRNQCLQSISKRIAIDSKQHQIKMKGYDYFSKDIKSQIMFCVDCKEILPKCSVCLIPITVYNGYAQEIRKNSTSEKKIKYNGQSLADAIVWCPKCFHGGHFNHMMKWAQRAQRKCAVYSCQCKCQWQE